VITFGFIQATSVQLSIAVKAEVPLATFVGMVVEAKKKPCPTAPLIGVVLVLSELSVNVPPPDP
jgi:hypothetical protein